jgi:hypothetical protein
MDLFVVPTLSFRLLYGLGILWHGRRQILWLGVTAHPSAEWIARQLAEACGWEWTPSYIVRDRDRVYGEIFTRRLPDTRDARSALSLAMTFDPMVLKKSHVHGARFQVIHGATGV